MSLPINQYFPDPRPHILSDAVLRDTIVNFNPRTIEEANDIQEALLAKGLVWLTGEKGVQRLDACVARGMHLDRGRIVTGHDRRGKYIDATLADLTGVSAPVVAAPEAPSMLTADFFSGKRVVFAPKTQEEARFVQETMFSFGFGWDRTGKEIYDLERCVKNKMLIDNGRMLTGPVERKENIFVEIKNLPGYDAKDLRGPQEKLQSRVSTLEAEVAALKEMVTKLTAGGEPVPILKPSVATDLKRRPPSV